MSEDYERVLLVKHEVFVYKIPPAVSNRSQRAADWKLDSPDFVGRLRLVSLSNRLIIKLEDKSGVLFAKAPITKYPGVDIEAVSDSSRYFVLRLQDDSGRSAFIGMGFADRGDSFDLNVSLQDYFKNIEKESKLETEVSHPGSQPKLDLGFKDGQTIKINIGKLGGSNTTASARPRSAAAASGGGPLLPPPPSSGSRIVPPPSARGPAAATKTASPLDDGLLQYQYNSDNNSSAASLGASSETSSNPFLTNLSSNNRKSPANVVQQEARDVGHLLDL